MILGHMVLGLLDKSLIMKNDNFYQHCIKKVEDELWKVCDKVIGLMDKNPIVQVPTEEYNVRKVKAKEYVQGPNLVLEEMVEEERYRAYLCIGKAEMGQGDAFEWLWDE